MNLHRINTAVPPAPTFRQRGFTLTEMAVVLVIVALLIGGMVLPISAQQNIRNVAETRQLLTNVTEALYGYAASHPASDGKPHLPCPDTDGDGMEDRPGNACAATEGDLPWADLGLGRQDAWGNPVRYAVANIFADSASGFTLIPSGTLLRICADGCTTVLAPNVPAAIYSRGKNGAGEQSPADTPPTFYDRTPTASRDDVVAWLPSTILVNRMISAGRLP